MSPETLAALAAITVVVAALRLVVQVLAWLFPRKPK